MIWIWISINNPGCKGELEAKKDMILEGDVRARMQKESSTIGELDGKSQ